MGLCGAVCEVEPGKCHLPPDAQAWSVPLRRQERWADFFFFKFYLFFKLEYKVVLVVKNPPLNTGDVKVASSTS